jgi:hypothetical protein
MHDLFAMYNKTYAIASEFFEDDVDENGNFQKSPRRPKMNDLQIIALAITTESACIDSENLLFSKLNCDYKERFGPLVHRTSFNRRRRKLAPQTMELIKRIAMVIDAKSDINIVDSMPWPIAKNSREGSLKICKENPEKAPAKGYSAVDRTFYIGYKLHLLSNEHGVVQDLMVTPANVHDIQYLKDLDPEWYIKGKSIIGDKGYISATLQADLFTQFDIELKVPYRRNQKSKLPLDPVLGKKRRRVETQFSQLCDQFRAKHNYAKLFAGFFARLVSKVAAMSVLQIVNLKNNRPLNHLKHAWA